jgi:hypothetical protein
MSPFGRRIVTLYRRSSLFPALAAGRMLRVRDGAGDGSAVTGAIGSGRAEGPRGIVSGGDD